MDFPFFIFDMRPVLSLVCRTFFSTVFASARPITTLVDFSSKATEPGSRMEELKTKASWSNHMEVKGRRSLEHFLPLKGREHLLEAVRVVEKELQKSPEKYESDPQLAEMWEAIRKFQVDGDISSVLMRGLPFSNKANSVLVAALVATEFGTKVYQVSISDSLKPQELHSDFGDSDESFPVTLLSGELVTGDPGVVTVFVKNEKLFGMLSKEHQEALQVAQFSSYVDGSNTVPLFYYNDKGVLCSKISSSEDVMVTGGTIDEVRLAKEALASLEEAMEQVEPDDIVKIMNGDVMIFDNKHYVHARKTLKEEEENKGFFASISSFFGEEVARHLLSMVLCGKDDGMPRSSGPSGMASDSVAEALAGKEVGQIRE